MFKRFIRNYGFSIITAVVITAIFFIGFLFGRYAKAAPSLEVIESEKRKQSQVVVSKTEMTTAPEVEPDYTEKEVTATAYCPCAKCCGKTDGITATGIKATAGRTIAVDPSVIPYGTEVKINGQTYVAEDKGGAIKGNRIDIFFDSHIEALEFGVQTLTVQVKK